MAGATGMPSRRPSVRLDAVRPGHDRRLTLVLALRELFSRRPASGRAEAAKVTPQVIMTPRLADRRHAADLSHLRADSMRVNYTRTRIVIP
jgi:hypothetical protein